MDWSSTPSYHITRPPGKDDEFDIQRKGRTVYLADHKSHLLHSEELRLVTPAIDGSTTAASAKLKASNRQCRVHLGDPERSSKSGWQNVSATDSLWTAYAFEHGGRRYLWRKVVPADAELKDIVFKLRITNMELVDEAVPDTVLATYQKTSASQSNGRLVGKFDIMAQLESDMETLALMAVLGLRECVELDWRSRNTPLAKGPFPGILGAGMVGGIGGGGGGGGA